MRSKEVKEAMEEIKHLKSFGTSGIVPRWATIDILLTYIEKLEKEEDRDYTTIYLKGVADKDGAWRDKIRDKIKELDEKYVELSKNKSSSEKAELNHEYIEKRSLLESLLGE